MTRKLLGALLVTTVVGAGIIGGYTWMSGAEAAEEKQKETLAAKGDDYVVVKYKGGEIKKSELDRIWNVLFPAPDAPDFNSFDDAVKVELLKNIARERLVLDRAYAKNIDHTDEVKKQLEHLKRQVVMQVYLKSIMDEIVPEKDVKKEYEVLKEKFKGKEEIRARHILVESEEEAKNIAKQLKDGGDFEAIAKEKSIDKASGAKGGDLGYFTKERMVPQFADVAFKTDKGEISAPVKSDFGWHIIKVEDRRPLNPPKYEEVKERIQAALAGNAVENYLNKLVEENNVRYFNAEGKELKAKAE